MNKGICFKIENHEFFLDDLNAYNSFEVKSMPHPYKVYWNEYEEPGGLINRLMTENQNNLLLIDDNVYKLYSNSFEFSDNRIFRLSAIEDVKNLNEVIKLIDFLQNRGFTKGETLIVVGGGITQDIGGFVGASYKRGINWKFIPTTLLSMCDSCIGGKVGINHNSAKNQIALFSSPYEIIINPKFLNTLDELQIRSGLGEMLKLHVLAGQQAISNYSKNFSADDLSYERCKRLIFAALDVKKAVIEIDEFESSYRKALNYGHTFGHAIEVLSGYCIPHGLAVVIGMNISNEISYRKGLLTLKDKQELSTLGNNLINFKTFKMVTGEGILELLKKDKKVRGNMLDIVLLESPGKTVFCPVELNVNLEEMIREVISTLYEDFEKKY